jgi:hypothetical protein
VPFNIACGRCRNCKEGKIGICLNVNPERPGSAYGYVDWNLLKLQWKRSSTCLCSPTSSRPGSTAPTAQASAPAHRLPRGPVGLALSWAAGEDQKPPRFP